MNGRQSSVLALAIVSALLIAGNLWAASRDRYTAIVVDDMHCAGCAKKIASKLYVVPGVVEVRANVEKSVAYVVPQRSKDPSPRLLWEAVEAAGFKPLKLQGPAGVFTKKPRT